MVGYIMKDSRADDLRARGLLPLLSPSGRLAFLPVDVALPAACQVSRAGEQGAPLIFFSS